MGTSLFAGFLIHGQSLSAWIFKMNFARNGFTPSRFECKVGQAMEFANPSRVNRLTISELITPTDKPQMSGER
jgi:hypothetical protein